MLDQGIFLWNNSRNLYACRSDYSCGFLSIPFYIRCFDLSMNKCEIIECFQHFAEKKCLKIEISSSFYCDIFVTIIQ